MAISSLMRRLGFVRLDAYGLVLTPEDRILSTRSTVLDDGLGQKIVGWQEADLAAMELERWTPAPVAPRSATAKPAAMPRAKPPTTPPVLTQRPLPGMTTAPVRPVAVAQPLGTAAPAQRRPPTPIPLETMPMARVADPTEVGEDGDEWEWEIAVARARAAAEWAEEAAQQIAATAPAPQPPIRKQRATSPIAIVAEPKLKDWSPETEPLNTIEPWDNTAPPVRVMPRLKSPTPAKPIVMIATHTPPPLPPAPLPPVSMLTMLPSVSPRAPLQPIVTPRTRSTTGQLPAMTAPRRFPRATPATTPDARMDRIGEDTQVNAAAANDDATRPGLLLPSASSTRRVAAKQR
ncbi:MAG: hypothetical protein ABI591_07855 [Kofleriaceae bacterium]